VRLTLAGEVIVMEERRESEFPYCGLKVNSDPLEMLSVIVVFDDPAPMIEMPIFNGTLTPVVQVHDPAGTLIVSPSTAVWTGPLMTAFTSL